MKSTLWCIVICQAQNVQLLFKYIGVFSEAIANEKTDIINEVGGLKNFKQQSYDINFIGDIRTEYSEEVVEQKDLEEKGLKCHLRWSNTVENKISDTANYNNFE